MIAIPPVDMVNMQRHRSNVLLLNLGLARFPRENDNPEQTAFLNAVIARSPTGATTQDAITQLQTVNRTRSYVELERGVNTIQALHYNCVIFDRAELQHNPNPNVGGPNKRWHAASRTYKMVPHHLFNQLGLVVYTDPQRHTNETALMLIWKRHFIPGRATQYLRINTLLDYKRAWERRAFIVTCCSDDRVHHGLWHLKLAD